MRPQEISFTGDMPIKAFVRNIVQYPFHWHKALEIIYVLEGSVLVGMGSEAHLLSKSNIAVINSNELHFINNTDGNNKLLILQIDSDFCEKVDPDFRYTFFYCCSPYHEADAAEKYNALRHHITHLIYHLSKKSGISPKKDIQSLLEEMLSQMIHDFDYLRYGTGSKAFDEKQVKRIRKIYEHIIMSPSEKYGLKEFAEEAGITLHHMSHDIKEKYGYTFQELLYYFKCEHAARLLLSTDKYIPIISAECGFSDPKYLIKHFKQNFQCTPSQFRRLHQADDKALISQMHYQEFCLSAAQEYLQKVCSSY